MKILLVLLLLLPYVSYSQEITKEEIKYNNIKSITAINPDGKKTIDFYNQEGNLIKEGNFENSKLKIDVEYTYNEFGILEQQDRYTTDGELLSKAKYYYNPQKNLIRVELMDSNGNIDVLWLYKYDDKGRKIEEIHESKTSGNSITKYTYGINNLLVEEEKSNNTIGKEQKINYTYDYEGRLIEKKTKYFFSNTVISQKLTYNPQGKLIKLIEKSSNGVNMTIIYDYTDNGLPISSSWKSSLSKKPAKTTYQIEI